MTSVSADYLSLGLMTLVGILFPLSAFILNRFFRPMPDPNDPTKLRSFLLKGYEQTNHCTFVVSAPMSVVQIPLETQ